MKQSLFALTLALGCMIADFPARGAAFGWWSPDDIFLVIYTTHDGKTGHVGMAVSNHRIVVRDTLINKVKTVVYDTVADGTLTYFDLWGPPKIELDEHDKNLAARYFMLPRTSAEQRLTPDYFLTRGLPHSYDYPCDALLRIRTDAAKDERMKEIAVQLQQERDYFNARRYNCTDYIIACLNNLFGTDLQAKEYIPFAWSSTPNCFYREVVSLFEVEAIKAAGPEVNESFFKERIMNTVLFNHQ